MRRRICSVQSGHCHGFTIIELIVVLAILGLLMALLIPAVQMSRGAARRVQCLANLKNIGIATHNYVDMHQQLPCARFAGGLLFSTLPFLDQSAEYTRLIQIVDGGPSQYAEAMSSAARVPLFLCPDDSFAIGPGASSYAVNRGLFDVSHQLRAFVPDDGRSLRWSDVPDGLSQTALCAEFRWAPQRVDLMAPPDPKYGNWFVNSASVSAASRDELNNFANDCLETSRLNSPVTQSSGISYLDGSVGYNHVLTPNAPRCTSAGLLFATTTISPHSGGTNVLLADGSVRFVSAAIGRPVWWALGSRDGGETEASGF